MDRGKALIAVMAAVIVAMVGLIVVKQNNQKTVEAGSGTSVSVPRPNATIDPANPPGGQPPLPSETDMSTTEASSSSTTTDEIPTRPPEYRSPSTWAPGTAGYSAVRYVTEYNSQSYADPSPVAWVTRTAAWVTPEFAAKNLDPIMGAASTEDPEWLRRKENKVSIGTSKLQVEKSGDGSPTMQTFTVIYHMVRSESGKRTVSESPTTYNVEVSKVGAKWLVSNTTYGVSL